MQSNTARAFIAVAAVALVIVGFLVLKDDGSENDVTTTTSATTQETTAQTTEPSANANTPPEKADKPEEAPEAPKIVVVGGAPEGGVADLEFNKGDDIRFTVESDVADGVHVHGYDIEQEIEAGGKTEFDFPAELEGVFEVELEESAVPIAELTVSP